MVKIKETMAVDMIMRAHDFMIDLLGNNMKLTDDQLDELVYSTRVNMRKTIKDFNLIWLPSSNEFRRVFDFIPEDRNLSVNEEDEPHNEHRVMALLISRTTPYMSDRFTEMVLNLVDPIDPEDEESHFFGRYLIYRTSLAITLFQMFLNITTIASTVFFPEIIPEEGGYIQLSMALNTFWHTVANTDTFPDANGIEWWIRPRIVVRPNCSINFANIDIVDSRDIIPKNL